MLRQSRGFLIPGRFVVALLLMVTAVAAVAASAGTRQAVAQDIQTRAIVLHAATDLGKVEVAFNSDTVAEELEYGDETDWVDVDPGTVQVWITRDRAGINYTVFNAVYPVPAGNDYYLIITDALVMAGTFDNSEVRGDNANVQITHASVDTPAVNVVATGAEINLATQLAFGRTSDAVAVPAGTYDAEVRLADTGEVLATATGGTVEVGNAYQYVLIGDPGDDDHPLELRALVTEASGEGTPPA
jgi:Domain of unknown function (DUF4397)